MDRRHVHKVLGTAIAVPLLSPPGTLTRAQADRPVIIVVPFGPGATTDLLGRLLAQHLAATLGRTVQVENRPGAASAIGAAHVARAAPDGNTLLIATSSTLAINPLLHTRLSYHPLRDFAPIGMIAWVPLALVVRSSMGVRSVGELVAVARRRPEGLAYGSPGHGSPQHLAGEMFKAATGATLRHVPYLGTVPALTGLLSGQIDVMFADLAPVLAHVRSQRVVALGVTSRARQPTLPEVPCIADAGVAGLAQFEALGWQSLVAPAGTPGEVVDRFNRLLVQLIDQPAVRERLQREGLEPRTGTPEQLATTIRTETDRWAKIIKAARIAVD